MIEKNMMSIPKLVPTKKMNQSSNASLLKSFQKIIWKYCVRVQYAECARLKFSLYVHYLLSDWFDTTQLCEFIKIFC